MKHLWTRKPIRDTQGTLLRDRWSIRRDGMVVGMIHRDIESGLWRVHVYDAPSAYGDSRAETDTLESACVAFRNLLGSRPARDR